MKFKVNPSTGSPITRGWIKRKKRKSTPKWSRKKGHNAFPFFKELFVNWIPHSSFLLGIWNNVRLSNKCQMGWKISDEEDSISCIAKERVFKTSHINVAFQHLQTWGNVAYSGETESVFSLFLLQLVNKYPLLLSVILLHYSLSSLKEKKMEEEKNLTVKATKLWFQMAILK